MKNHTFPLIDRNLIRVNRSNRDSDAPLIHSNRCTEPQIKAELFGTLCFVIEGGLASDWSCRIGFRLLGSMLKL